MHGDLVEMPGTSLTLVMGKETSDVGMQMSFEFDCDDNRKKPERERQRMMSKSLTTKAKAVSMRRNMNSYIALGQKAKAAISA